MSEPDNRAVLCRPLVEEAHMSKKRKNPSFSSPYFPPNLEPEVGFPRLTLIGVGSVSLSLEEVRFFSAEPGDAPPNAPYWFAIEPDGESEAGAIPVPGTPQVAQLFLDRFEDDGCLCASARAALGDVEHEFEASGRRRRKPKLRVMWNLSGCRFVAATERLAQHSDAVVREMVASRCLLPDKVITRLLQDSVESVRLALVARQYIPYGTTWQELADCMRGSRAIKLEMMRRVFGERRWMEHVPELAMDDDPVVAQAYRTKAEEIVKFARRAVELVGFEKVEDDDFSGEDFMWAIVGREEEHFSEVDAAFELLKRELDVPPVSWVMSGVRGEPLPWSSSGEVSDAGKWAPSRLGRMLGSVIAMIALL